MEDQKWRETVNDRLAALTASEVVQNDRLDEVDDELRAIRAILEGKSDDRNDNGIKGDVQEMSRSINVLRAIMAPDQLGNGGVINRLKALERKSGVEETVIKSRWAFYGVLVAAVLSFAGLVLTNLDRIGPSLKRIWQKQVRSESTKPKRSSGRTSRKPRTRPPVIEAPAEVSGADQEGVPEGRGGADSPHR